MPEITETLRKALRLIGLEDAELSILFTGSAGIRRLNRQYRGMDKETDVLSFPMEEDMAFSSISSLITHHSSRSLVLGDIVISVPKAARQAGEYNSSFEEELLRLLIHGLLHLVGYDHEINRYQRLRMEKKEQEIINAVARMA